MGRGLLGLTYHRSCQQMTPGPANPSSLNEVTESEKRVPRAGKRAGLLGLPGLGGSGVERQNAPHRQGPFVVRGPGWRSSSPQRSRLGREGWLRVFSLLQAVSQPLGLLSAESCS